MLSMNRQLISYRNNPKYFSKVVMMPNGVEALVIFELIERNGHLIAKAIYAEAVDINSVPEQKICCLPGIKSPKEFIPVKSVFYNLASDFFRDYSFVKSQPTRAPSCA